MSSFNTLLRMFTPFMFLVSKPTCFVTVMTVFCISALSKRTRKRGNYRGKSNSNVLWACLGLLCFYVWDPHCKKTQLIVILADNTSAKQLGLPAAFQC